MFLLSLTRWSSSSWVTRWVWKLKSYVLLPLGKRVSSRTTRTKVLTASRKSTWFRKMNDITMWSCLNPGFFHSCYYWMHIVRELLWMSPSAVCIACVEWLLHALGQQKSTPLRLTPLQVSQVTAFLCELVFNSLIMRLYYCWISCEAFFLWEWYSIVCLE